MSKADERSDKRGFKKRAWTRSPNKIRLLQMYNTRAKRDAKGNVLYEKYQSKSVDHDTRIAPDIRWFTPSRSLHQQDMDRFREELKKQSQDPYTITLRQRKVPYSLLQDAKAQGRMHILETESFENTFGPRSQRKRPKLECYDLKELAEKGSSKFDAYNADDDRNIERTLDYVDAAREPIFSKGTSKRLWTELWKVVDSSDVIIQVIDARDPVGTRSLSLEKKIKKDRPHKHIVLLLNKCDLVPPSVTKRWLKILRKERPTVAFQASIKAPFGKGALIQVLRQFAKLMSQPSITVGFIGYPNVGKSSVVNTLKRKTVCLAAPVPGHTKVWQYVRLFSSIFLIDSPGVVLPGQNSDADAVLRGVVRVENVEEPEQYIPELFKRTNPRYIADTYGVTKYRDPAHFLEIYCKQCGFLKKGGEPNISQAAIRILRDWQRGRIPYFVPPPEPAEGPAERPLGLLDTVDQKVQEFIEETLDEANEENEEAEGVEVEDDENVEDEDEEADTEQPDKRPKALTEDDLLADPELAPGQDTEELAQKHNFTDDGTQDEVDWDTISSQLFGGGAKEPTKKKKGKKGKKKDTKRKRERSLTGRESRDRKAKRQKEANNFQVVAKKQNFKPF